MAGGGLWQPQEMHAGSRVAMRAWVVLSSEVTVPVTSRMGWLEPLPSQILPQTQH